MKSYKELMTEASYFDMSDIEDWKKEIENGIKAPVVHIQISTLGGEDRVSLMVKFSMDKEASKGGTEWHNSRHANLRVDRDGTLEMFQMSYKFDTKRLRKSKIKSAKDVVKKINDWIKKVK